MPASKKRAAAKSKKLPAKKVDTKDLILDACLETVRREGLGGTSARSIAKTGDFNQALVFYHFGSVDELLLASLQRANDRRKERFAERLEAIDNLAGLVAIGSELFGGPDDPDSAALAAIVAGWSNTDDMGKRVMSTMDEWNVMVEGAISRALEGSVFRSLVPADELAYVVSALYLGMEMLSRLDPEDDMSAKAFESLGQLAVLAQPMLGKPRAKTRGASGEA